jgi:hypothetical protein
MSTGSSNRLSYDQSAYNASIGKSTDPMGYMLSNYASNNCDKCYPEVSINFPLDYNNVSESLIDVENTLSTRDWKKDKREMQTISKDHFYQKVEKYKNSFLVKDCNDTLISHNSLLTNPKSQTRAFSTQHLVFTPVQTSEEITPIWNNPGFVSSRDVAIDLYRKKMNITTPR